MTRVAVALLAVMVSSCAGVNGGSGDARLAAGVQSTVRSTTTTTTMAPSTTNTAVVPRSTATVTTTLPRSPLADLLGPTRSARPRSVGTAPEPTHLVIDEIDVDHPVRAVGLEPDGQLEIPDESEVGWYRLGAAPGETGAVVLAGHVSWNGVNGPFLELDRLDPGASVHVELADGSRRDYTVVEHAQYPKPMLPAARIWTRTGAETLVLITCGGDFNSELRRYYDNIVVYAEPTD